LKQIKYSNLITAIRNHEFPIILSLCQRLSLLSLVSSEEDLILFLLENFYASVKFSTFLRVPIILIVQRISSTKYVTTLSQLITEPSSTAVHCTLRPRMTGTFTSITAKTAYSAEKLPVGARHEDKKGHDITASEWNLK
jgi:hypothetical protein